MNYYKSLKKDEKDKVKEDYFKNNDNNVVYKKINRIYVLSILGIVISIIAGVFDVVFQNGVINYIVDVLLAIFSLIVFIKTTKMKCEELNRFALENKKVIKKDVSISK
jgi:predicted Co/Zn/Cd cation transporter (cation efflux family)